MKSYLITLKNWSGYAAVITLMFFLVYIAVQQTCRMSANDPQLQLARDAAYAIDKGADPRSLVNTTQSFEMSQNLSPFVVIYDTAGNIAAGNATLNGSPLKVPQFVVDYVRKNGTDAVSWQPQPDVRDAMVAFSTADKRYVVVAGKSLAPTEDRIARFGQLVLVAWVMSLAAMLAVVVLQQMVTRRLEQRLV